MKSKWVWVLLAAALGSAAYAGNVLATTSTAPPPTILAKAQFGDIDINAHTLPADLWHAQVRTRGNSDVYIVDNKLPAGATTGWHSHPGPSLILVTAGTVTNHTADNCAGQTYSAGSGFIDAGGDDVHMLTNDGSFPAETTAVQLLPQGATRRIDKPAPANCTG